ncbi:MAG: hypothetical protein K9N11_04100 [Lentisphaeria bacterium]|nr:hypothetical protein [Candidatus Neomarinimicrobiota bacterium]MCF7842015.1 hypothetical protein [Lentisphaeria bacterium]
MKAPTRNILRNLCAVTLLAWLAACTKNVPLSEFNFDYTAQIKIEGDFFPANLGKSILRVDHTFAISDTMDLEHLYVKNADAVLLHGIDTLSHFSWQDSASSFAFYNIPEFNPEIMQNPDSLVQYIDTLTYGGYTLDRLDFQLLDDETYTLVVTVDGVDYTTTFSPFPAIQIENLTVDSVRTFPSGIRGDGTYTMTYTTIAQYPDSARLIWQEDPTAWFYTVYTDKLDAEPRLLPNMFSYPGPVLSVLGVDPGVYELVIGVMNDTFYKHYYLRDFPPNHPARNFFDNGALGYAGTLNEVYLTVNLISAPMDSTP